MAEAGAVEARFDLLRSDGSQRKSITRQIPIEAPIAIEYNGIGYAVMMATPIDLEDFALGFSLSEELISSADQIIAVDAHEASAGWVLRIQLAEALMEPIIERARQRVSESSCGLCGIETLEQVMRPLPRVTAQFDVPHEAIFVALSRLRELQPLNAATGAAHAAALCTTSGNIILVREDVGRHTALDKLIGAAARAGLSLSDAFILLTSRCSYELVQKAVLANCPLLVTISVATSLAVDRAAAHGLSLISLARDDSALASGQNPA